MKSVIKRILKEETELPLFVKRQYAEIEYMVEVSINELERVQYTCDFTKKEFISTVIDGTIHTMYWELYSEQMSENEWWRIVREPFTKFLKKEYTSMITDYYNERCPKKLRGRG